jgi:HD-like signal output (HDOD) protein
MGGEPYKLIDAEKRFIGTTHCEIGLLIAKRWNFPADYCEVISNHHAPQEATLDPTLVAIVNLADFFCSVRQLDYGGRAWVSFNLAEEGAWEVLIPEIQDLVKSIFEGMVVR